MPPTFNSWVQTEDMLLFHLRSLQQQLEQTYVAMALAAATGRTFVLPEARRPLRGLPSAADRCRCFPSHAYTPRLALPRP